MRLIKIIVISLYTIILGFIVFGNTSVFADTEGATQVSVFQTSSDFTDYFVNMQDNFDFSMLNYKDRNGLSFFYNAFVNPSTAWAPRPAWNYFVESSPSVPGATGSATAKRGWVITIYAASQDNNLLVSDTDFQFINFTDYNSVGTFKVPTVPVHGWWKIGIYDDGRSYTFITNGASFTYNCPVNILNYSHPLVNNYLLNTNTNGASQVTNAIQQQTNTIVNETQKQTNEITSTISNATQQQTNQLLDTNDTGNETMSVNDTTTDTSADLGGLFNSINSAFTDTTSETQKGFDLQLPNGDTHTFTLKANVLTSFLDANSVLKAFYQAFFFVVFGGYVIFDFKKIINKLKEGNIDNVVGSSSPVDSVVNMSLK